MKSVVLKLCDVPLFENERKLIFRVFFFFNHTLKPIELNILVNFKIFKRKRVLHIQTEIEVDPKLFFFHLSMTPNLITELTRNMEDSHLCLGIK